ncbi:1-acyl-sn-glycerol-3-phosphate acyltransferase [Natronospira bacteriovora]|uniref:Glycerol-3-phosphate acyltransferase n=1 Tax=Natronospira bacteriovora TaxID=3069753 RepID=A0ABU0W6Q7_9GAMM|nr:1-acyl-sn-glycerol-3-phosphate acyltransferase [Natronospira sp. AB-CW4]MDQ2069694.1 1-acyl-sn-glycerol-3-phosphate acyltransferase [Natronospira sp. AB-CW4]
MTETIEVPLWLLLAIALLALWVLLERLLLPSVRWFFRRRVNLLIDQLNRRLKLRLPTFSLTKRRVLIDRLVYDPTVLEEVRQHCQETGAPWAAALQQVESYAREIVPSFNAYFYFRFGNQIARWLVQRLYRVRLSEHEQGDLANIDPAASIVFVINHRSNMDYVLVSHLAHKKTALSYAVGEWARVWPLQQMVKAMGAYFVRRGSNNALYRRVLERYVQMAVEGGVVQAVFPEGGLSRDGHFREPRIGLIDYMLRAHDPESERDIIFIPVCINYDRVIEDRTLLREASGKRAERKSAISAIWGTLRFLGRSLNPWRAGRWHRMGYAAAGFGQPISVRDWCRQQGVHFNQLPRKERIDQTRRFADELMTRIAETMPVLPVSLISWLMLAAPARAWTREQLEQSYAAAIAALRERHAKAYVPRREAAYAVEIGLKMLRVRSLIQDDEDGYRLLEEETPVLQYYANAIDHLMRDLPRQSILAAAESATAH